MLFSELDLLVVRTTYQAEVCGVYPGQSSLLESPTRVNPSSAYTAVAADGQDLADPGKIVRFS